MSSQRAAASRPSCSPTSRRRRTRRRAMGDDAAAAPVRRARPDRARAARRPRRAQRPLDRRRLPRAVRLRAQRGRRARWRSSAELAAHEDGVRVRIGLNAGEVRRRDGELFGAAINLAARVMDRAGGGAGARHRHGPAARGHDARRALPRPRPRRAEGLPRAPAPPRGRARPTASRHARRRRAAAPGARARRRRRWRRSRPRGAVALGDHAAATEAVDVAPNSVAILDPDDGRVVAQVPVGVRPADLAVGARIGLGGQPSATTRVTQIGARSRRVAGTVSPGIGVDGLGGGPERRLGRRRRARARARDRPRVPQRRALATGSAGGPRTRGRWR